jgi:hypothetical protein
MGSTDRNAKGTFCMGILFLALFILLLLCKLGLRASGGLTWGGDKGIIFFRDVIFIIITV